MTKCVDHLGNVFHNVETMCKYYHIAPEIFEARINKGWTIRNALLVQSKMGFKKLIKDHCGRIFKSKREMFEYWHIPYQTGMSRLYNYCWSIEKALTTPVDKTKRSNKTRNEYDYKKVFKELLNDKTI